MSKVFEFNILMLCHPGMNAGYAEFPFDVYTEFGTRGPVKVKAWFDGYLYRGSLVSMGHKCHWIGIPQKIRNIIHKHPGDVVHIRIEQDTDPRLADIPPSLQSVLDEKPELAVVFHRLSFTRQKEMSDLIRSAVKPETRKLRLQKIIRELSCWSTKKHESKSGK